MVNLRNKENDLIKGIWLAKSLHAFDAIRIDPSCQEKVWSINQKEKAKAIEARITSGRYFLNFARMY